MLHVPKTACLNINKKLAATLARALTFGTFSFFISAFASQTSPKPIDKTGVTILYFRVILLLSLEPVENMILYRPEMDWSVAPHTLKFPFSHWNANVQSISCPIVSSSYSPILSPYIYHTSFASLSLYIAQPANQVCNRISQHAIYNIESLSSDLTHALVSGPRPTIVSSVAHYNRRWVINASFPGLGQPTTPKWSPRFFASGEEEVSMTDGRVFLNSQ